MKNLYKQHKLNKKEEKSTGKNKVSRFSNKQKELKEPKQDKKKYPFLYEVKTMESDLAKAKGEDFKSERKLASPQIKATASKPLLDSFKPKEYISLAKASQAFSIPRNYLNVLIHRNKIEGKKTKNKWHTTRTSIENYLEKTRKISVKKTLPVLEKPIILEKEKKIKKPKTELEKINQQLIEMGKSFQAVASSTGKGEKPKKRLPFSLPSKFVMVATAAIILMFLFVAGGGYGFIQAIGSGVVKLVKDATTIQGHWPGTHANEVLLLDEDGKISIKGHIETKGQIRSWVKQGVAPLVVDSSTMVEKLNAEMLNGKKSKEFNLAFITENGNITEEDVYLNGKVEIGKTLLVTGATKLLDSLLVNGELGVWGDIIGRGDLVISGKGSFGNGITTHGDINTSGNDINLGIGTIKTTNTDIVENLNADMLDSAHLSDLNLDLITDQGNSTSNRIKIGGLDVSGISNFDSMTFHNDGLWATIGSFNTALGVGGFFSASGPVTLGDGSEDVVINASNWDVDDSGNITASEITSSGNLTTNSNLEVDGNANIDGNLTMSGVFTADSSASHSFLGDLEVQDVVSASYFFGDGSGITGITGATITSNSLDFDEIVDAMTLDSNLTIASSGYSTTWNSDFSIGNDLTVSGTGTHSFAGILDPNQVAAFTLTGDITGGDNNIYDLNTLEANTIQDSEDGRININDALIISGYLANSGVGQFGNTTTTSYSRFGIGTTGHSLSKASDLLISGDLEADGYAWFASSSYFASTASVSGDFEVGSDKFKIDSSTGNAIIAGDLTMSGVFTADSSASHSFLGDLEVQDVVSASYFFGDGSGITGVSGATVTSNSLDWDEIVDSMTLDSNLTVASSSGYSTTWNSDFSIGNDLTVSGTGTHSFEGILDPNQVAAFTLTGDITGNDSSINDLNTLQANTLEDNEDGRIDINDALIVSGYLSNSGVGQFGNTTTTSYSRFGIGTTDHSLSKASDLLISGDLEADGYAWFASSSFFASTASVSGDFEVEGNTILGDQDSDTLTITGITNFASVVSHSAAGEWNFDSNTLVVDSGTNRVGIGTITPDGNLHIESAGSATLFLDKGSSQNAYFDIKESGTTRFQIKNDTSNNTYFKVNANGWKDAIYLDGLTGKVGIKTDVLNADFDVAGSGIFDNELIVTEALQVGSATSAAYSQFGSGTMGHGLDAADDLLVADDLEVDGNAWFDSNASVSNNFEVGGIIYGDGSGITGVSGANVASNSLDFDELVNSMTLDSNLTIASSGYSWDFNDINVNFENGIWDTNGNVGIGTTNLTQKLEVSGTASVSSDLYVHGTIYDGASDIDDLYINESGDSTGDLTSNLNIDSDTFVIDYAGNTVGIGTIPLSGTLHIKKSGGSVLIENTSGYANLELRNSGTVNDGDELGYINSYDSGGNFYSGIKLLAEDSTNHYGGIAFRIAKSGGEDDVMKIDKDGNVGIGTVNLTQKLEVSGIASISSDLYVHGTIYDGASDIDDIYVNESGDTMAGTLNMNANIITNIGNAGTDFDVNGGLNLIEDLNIEGDIDMATGKKITWVDDNQYISGTATVINIDSDDNLNLFADVDVDIDAPLIDLSTQTVDVTLNNAVDALNFDSNTLSIDASNNRVGIGTTSPRRQLDVGGTGHIAFVSHDITADSNAGLYWFSSSNYGIFRESGVWIEPHPRLMIEWDTGISIDTGGAAGEDIVLANSGGNVGIGTTAPGALLHIDEADAQIGLLVQGGSGGTDIARFQRDVGASGIININSDGGSPQIEFNDEGAGDWSLGTYTTGDSFRIAQNSAIGTNDKFVISTTGNVGIGTTSPVSKLNIKSSTADAQIRLHNSKTGTTTADGLLLSLGNVAKGYLWNYEDDSLILGTNNTARVTILNTGNVGIGTTDPSTKLDVEGDITMNDNDILDANTVQANIILDSRR